VTEPTELVQSLDRGLAVIRAFDAEKPELTVSDVARATGLSRASARRFLYTLVELGYMRTDGRVFAIRPKVLELGHAYLSSLSLPRVAKPHLERLVECVHESSSVSVLDGDEVVCVARVPTRRIMRIAIAVGTRFPAYATSTGRVLLAGQSDDWLDAHLARVASIGVSGHAIVDVKRLRAEIGRVRRTGYALIDQEPEEGLRSLAAPIRDRDDRVVAAVNVLTHAGSGARLRDTMLTPLLQTAAAIEGDLRPRGHQSVHDVGTPGPSSSRRPARGLRVDVER
jgi:IclR family pca regulon transcriptional regulator